MKIHKPARRHLAITPPAAGITLADDFCPPGYKGNTGGPAVFDLAAEALQQLRYMAGSAGRPA